MITIHFSTLSVEFEKILVTNEFDGAIEAYPVDFDIDGDMDILGVSIRDNQLAWWENSVESDNLTFTKHIIADDVIGASWIRATDMDLDGDLDIIATAYEADELAWWENDAMSFIKHPIATEYDGAGSINAADLDLDGDIDLVSTSVLGGNVDWWENTGQNTPIFIRHRLTSNFSGAKFSYIDDFDLDGDQDLITTGWFINKISLWENNGSRGFIERIIVSDYSSAHGAFTADIDGDGDLDTLGASYSSNSIDWFETDGDEFIRHSIASFNSPTNIFAMDIDDDGDMDILSTEYNGQISWFENDGKQEFSEHIIQENFRGTSCYAADFDNDGDLDVLGSSSPISEISIWLFFKKSILF